MSLTLLLITIIPKCYASSRNPLLRINSIFSNSWYFLGWRLVRLGTCFSLLSLSEKLSSVKATKLRLIYWFSANLLSEKHQFTFQPQYSSASSASMPPKYSLESKSLGSFVLTGIVLVWISNEPPIFSTNILGLTYIFFILIEFIKKINAIFTWY